jgi:hypothetical protein
MAQPVGALLPFRKQLDVLIVVDLDEGQGQRSVRIVDTEGFGVTQQVSIELPRLFDIGRIQGHVRQSENFRPLRLGSRGGKGQQKRH